MIADDPGGHGMPAPARLPDLSRTEAYDYDLPPDRIARYPVPRRDQSRLLVVEGDRPFGHHHFSELPGIVAAGDLLVVNESRVLPVRLLGRKPTGAPAEVLLLRHADPGDDPARWEALVRPGSKLKPGRRVIVAPDGELEVLIEDGLPGGARRVRIVSTLPPTDAIERYGRIPLPPYIEREDDPADRERYQTVYARTPGSVAAPTAGLHFTPELLDRLKAGGVEVAHLSLHVGPGTFRPVEADVIGDHRMDRERWELPAATAHAIARTRSHGGRIWAVGTTVVRTLEAAADESGAVHAGSGETELFIAPGYRFCVVEGLITNFHLPRSTLLMLVAAFAGHRRTMEAYAEAVREGYRFYSYGDAMAVLP